MKESKDSKFIPMSSVSSHREEEVRPDVFYYTNQIVNVIMIGDPRKGNWILVDTGMPRSAEEIYAVAKKRFNRPPVAIVLTHGHFDHSGNVVKLLQKWRVPVYAHRHEFPYLTGQQSYPEPDTSVEGGMMAKVSFMYPVDPVNISESLIALPPGGGIPGVPGWRWIHVPGHTPGQVALFRESDRVLISADAVITVRQDSFYKVLIGQKEINGPPRYLTTDWTAAWESVKKLQQLAPEIMVPGHGEVMEGRELEDGLKELADHFDELAIPDHGKYVNGNREKE